jgi:predicted ATPase/class 3 adenylate cyclase/Tfp pilus assembly protein PilF
MPRFHALLITDVVDSTRLTEALGDAAMATLWTAHDRAARDLLPVWHGREIDKTDGMLLLFDRPADAVGYALAYHRALAGLGLPFKARAGLHVGPVSLRENSAADIARGAKPVEVDGLALPIAARVMSIALGGQTLLSADARLALGVVAQRVQTHGHWRLQGVAEPVELFEIGDDDAPFATPPDAAKAYRVVRQDGLWLPVHEIRHSLPAERDGFVGRRDALAALAQRLEHGTRLVSVLGMGGTGKTRLVTRFAWGSLGEFPGGVWFCDLAPARSPDDICAAVAHALEVPPGQADPVVQLGHAIAGRGRCLVILDNFEQVARHAEATLGHWLDRAAHATFIVTTREVLGIVGEDVLALAPLPTAEASTLFRRRAEAARQDYRPSPEDEAAIEQLVKVLDGLPLAIELAAARVRVMPPRMLLARMSERFKLLWSSAGRHDRQATLRAAFDWSWELLSPAERAALAQLSVFEGGFTLASVEAVVDLADAADAPWSVDVLNWLVDKSFVRQVGDDRFDLLESVREYAAEHLRTEGRYPGSGALAEAAAQRRHWRHYAGLDERAAVAGGCAETRNLVAACRRAGAAADASSAVGALLGAWAALRLRGPFRVGAGLAQAVGELGGLTPRWQAEVHWVAGSALDLLGDVTSARQHFDAGLAKASAAGERHCEARLLAAAAAQDSSAGQLHEALEQLTRALAIARGLGERRLQCTVLNALGRLADHQARFDEARGFYEAALALARELGDRRLEGGLLGNLGGLLHDDGRLDEARALYEQALALAHEVGDRRWEGNARCNLGLLHHQQGHAAAAHAAFEAALTLAREVGHVRLECTVHCNLGLVLEAGDPAAALTHHERAVTIAHDLGDRRLEGQFRGYLGTLDARLGRHADARVCLAAGEALLVESADQLSLALLLCGRAEAEHLAGDAQAAQRYVRRAQELAAQTRVGADSELGRALARLQALLETARAL